MHLSRAKRIGKSPTGDDARPRASFSRPRRSLSCERSNIHQASKPHQLSDVGCTIDTIMNYNGLPQNVAPCRHVTRQTNFLGPTEQAVTDDPCVYQNEQVIEVTLEEKDTPRAGKVITTAGSASTSCDWEEQVFK